MQYSIQLTRESNMIQREILNGLVVYKVVIRGTVVSSHMSLQGAKYKVLRILNSLAK